MSEVWDVNWFGSTKTLDVHIASLRRKLRDASFIDTARGVGFRFAAPEGEGAAASPAREDGAAARTLLKDGAAAQGEGET